MFVGFARTVRICINPTSQPDRIALDIAPELRIVVPEVVVVQPRLRVVILAGEVKVVGWLPVGAPLPNGS